jgi:hypothetical protein
MVVQEGGTIPAQTRLLQGQREVEGEQPTLQQTAITASIETVTEMQSRMAERATSENSVVEMLELLVPELQAMLETLAKTTTAEGMLQQPRLGQWATSDSQGSGHP